MFIANNIFKKQLVKLLLVNMASEPKAKKFHTVAKRIGTHNGTFHCDEVLACCMLQLLPQYEDTEIVRSRDHKVLDTCDVVVDVGGVYEPSSHRYDHHQRYDSTTNTGRFNNY